MSKRSRENKRLRRLAELSKQPITGSFEQRAAAIIKEDNVDKKVDNRLPAHYGGCPSWGNGWRNPASDSGYKPITIEKKAEDIFRVKSTDITEGNCPIAKVPKVYVTTRMWNEWVGLAEDYSTEWLAYLTGSFVKDDKGSRYEIRKMYFPPQVAHATHVDVDDDFSDYQPNTIGAIHSHVGMGVFFSGEDMAHSNWPVEIVVNNKGEAKVMIRHQLECGQWIKNYSEVLTVGDNADKKYTSMLDMAFEAGEELRQKRVVKGKVKDSDYRTPDVKEPVHYQQQQQPFTYDQSQEWHFQVNGRPMRWKDMGEGSGCYVEVVKVDGKWVDKDSLAGTVADATGNSEDTRSESVKLLDKMIDEASITIDDTTGQVVMEAATDDGHGLAAATQEELDRLMESEVDNASCIECGGTGHISSQGMTVECASCGGSGLKPGMYGLGEYAC